MTRKDIVLAITGVLCAGGAVLSIASSPTPGFCQIAALIIALPLALIAGTCFACFIAPKIGAAFGGFVYMPRECLRSAPDKIAPIKGLIEQKKYPEAIAALNVLLARQPYMPQLYLMLVEVYMDRLHKPHEAANLIKNFFQRNKLPASPENAELLMRYSDLCLQGGQPEVAIELFERQLAGRNYTVPERHALELRLEALAAAKPQRQ